VSEDSFREYFTKLREKKDTGTEHTLRTDFENLLNSIKPDPSIIITQEPKKEDETGGRPDFKVTINDMIIGYIETKPVGMDLDRIIDPQSNSRDAQQLRAYMGITPNLMLTNYNEFILFRDGATERREHLFYLTDKKLDISKVGRILNIFNEFFISTPKKITLPENLADLLAKRASLLRDSLLLELESKKTSQFMDVLLGHNGLLDLVRETLIQDLTKEEFIDAYTQTITYGLFLAKLNCGDAVLSQKNVTSYISASMGIIQELFETIKIRSIPSSVGWVIEEILNVLNNTDVDEIRNGLSFSKTYENKDPYVYFYENFLKVYDPEERIDRGVFYTPTPIVLFIINNVQHILKTCFQTDGIKDSGVLILDFAAGTGTFLLEAFKIALDETDTGVRRSLIRDHLLRHFYGFEYLIAPYTIAHLKLSSFLENFGYKIGEHEKGERLRVYLTDTLDDQRHKKWSLLPRLSKEGEESYSVKMKQPILAVIGNPPYNVSSRNRKPFAETLIQPYKEGLAEKKVTWDDYEKFLAYAQWKIAKNGKGIIGVITNNSFLDSITKKIMRSSILKDFDYLYVLNLHGNKNRGERDENVFDIMVGVAISIFVKLPQPLPLSEKRVFYYSTLEKKMMKREEKYQFLLKNRIEDISWMEIKPKPPDYYFVPEDLVHKDEYSKFWSLKDIFSVSGSGIKTDRDSLFIDFDKEALDNRMQTLFSGNYDQHFIEEYRVKDSSSYPLLKRLKVATFDPNSIFAYHYRPFDYRWVYYKLGITSRPASKVMSHLMKKNLALITVRQFAEDIDFSHAFVTNGLTDIRITVSNRGTCYIFPLYTYVEVSKNNVKQTRLNSTSNEPNVVAYDSNGFAPNFKDEFSEFISTKYSSKPEPEDILGYIYAILYSPFYRKRYNTFLKKDFPRIPFTDDYDSFMRLATLGKSLVANHLLQVDYGDSEVGRYPQKGENKITKVDFNKSSNRLFINEKQCFENVSYDIFSMNIGGYQVVYKWLRDRVGKVLSYSDLEKFQKILNSLAHTLRLMNKIDSIFCNAHICEEAQSS
jgi:hypothetical protein